MNSWLRELFVEFIIIIIGKARINAYTIHHILSGQKLMT
jgi:hypothetical protein